MNVILVLMLFVGVMLVMANELVAARRQVRVEYRYLPRDLDTYLREAPLASVEFKGMFDADDVRLGGN